ncbi:MAG: SH3 domain-containing protein [Pseudoruegeria sp.]
MFRLLALLGVVLFAALALAPEIEDTAVAPASAPATEIVLASLDLDAPLLLAPAEEPTEPNVEAAAAKAFPPANRVAKMTSKPMVSQMLAVHSSDAPVGYQNIGLTNATSNAADIWYVSGNRVNMRSGPSTQNQVVAALARGTATELLGRTGGWVHIRDLNSGNTGYMSANFLRQ